jgi:hypothetical protein
MVVVVAAALVVLALEMVAVAAGGMWLTAQ